MKIHFRALIPILYRCRISRQTMVVLLIERLLIQLDSGSCS